MKYCERSMQAILMRWLLNDKHHEIAVTNSTVLFPWEADLASVTRAGYVHEIEIKISVADFRKDADKRMKHRTLQFPQTYNHDSVPNYFWYATPQDIEIDVPEYAGRLAVYEKRSTFYVDELKPAPRLHTRKIDASKTAVIARLLSFRHLSNTWEWMQAEFKRQAEGGAR